MSSLKDHLLNIKGSYKFLDWEEDWDEDGAEKVNLLAFNKYLLLIHALIRIPNLACPYIGLCRDGSMDIHFICDSNQLLINVREQDSSYFGYNKLTTTNQIKGTKIDLVEITTFCEKFLIG